MVKTETSAVPKSAGQLEPRSSPRRKFEIGHAAITDRKSAAATPKSNRGRDALPRLLKIKLRIHAEVRSPHDAEPSITEGSDPDLLLITHTGIQNVPGHLITGGYEALVNAVMRQGSRRITLFRTVKKALRLEGRRTSF